MINSRYQWEKPTIQNQKAVNELSETFGISKLIAKILVNRGYDTVETANAFLRPEISALYDPFLLHDMDKAIERLFQAIDNGESIVVYGDYDVDGMTSTAIMTWALELMGANVTYFVPSRFSDGYGPNLANYQKLAADGMQLLVTVDNGVSGKAEIAWLMSQGIDVVITDHHELPADLPVATAIVHPRHPDGEYPFGGLSGAGVAFKVASALLEEPADEVLDLAALGTVADVMSLTDENRIIVKQGLENLKLDPRPGLSALLAAAGTQLSDIDSSTIGFTIAPRLNSLGRLEDATTGVQLLLMDDDESAKPLAEHVNELNQKRQQLVNDITVAAQAQAQELSADPVLVVAGEGWHEGVLGIVASKLVEQTDKPAIVLTINDDEMKGSGRSVAAFDLFNALDGHRGLMTNFGGHASAAGMTIPTDNLAKIRSVLKDEAAKQSLATAQKAQLPIAAEVTVSDFTQQNFDNLQVLAPFGEGNPEPLFVVNVDKVDKVKTMSDGKHLRFTAQTDAGVLPVIAFGWGQQVDALNGHFSSLQVIGTMSQNTFRGSTTYQLMLKDMAAQGAAILDKRTSRLTKQTFAANATYVFFNQNHYQQLSGYIAQPSNAMMWHDIGQQAGIQTMVLVDLPESLAQLKDLLQHAVPARLIPMFYVKTPVYLQKVPDKQTFAKVFKFVNSFKNIDLNTQFDNAVNHLKIHKLTLQLILKVFLEAKFVIIENGILNAVPNPASLNLSETETFQKFMVQRDLERQLIYSTTAELETLLMNLSKQES
ncbi:single-stranded-DNA-specific exonuclease RecJ [Weissella hellenica]|uniref:Single-stranded-DNA-specific exonuclease RecJ n=1 Tax=Weissella hellenica TaxID=46256 RepID=A0A4Y4G8E3_WEIHE|nr:single-stranded-DNA-specific exonuclease RecJ [Weissella hellenica]NKY67658.1 single-stranded-DNA-specific exonuclease RecJ [Weissella hellenica]GED36814.1 single-stranded-DNA-specific exonuclease [Weissella hellenica]SCC10494.1 single-stranded-DNA-specific exonuclease [Weissella hellenica]